MPDMFMSEQKKGAIIADELLCPNGREVIPRQKINHGISVEYFSWIVS